MTTIAGVKLTPREVMVMGYVVAHGEVTVRHSISQSLPHPSLPSTLPHLQLQTHILPPPKYPPIASALTYPISPNTPLISNTQKLKTNQQINNWDEIATAVEASSRKVARDTWTAIKRKLLASAELSGGVGKSTGDGTPTPSKAGATPKSARKTAGKGRGKAAAAGAGNNDEDGGGAGEGEGEDEDGPPPAKKQKKTPAPRKRKPKTGKAFLLPPSPFSPLPSPFLPSRPRSQSHRKQNPSH